MGMEILLFIIIIMWYCDLHIHSHLLMFMLVTFNCRTLTSPSGLWAAPRVPKAVAGSRAPLPFGLGSPLLGPVLAACLQCPVFVSLLEPPIPTLLPDTLTG